MGHQLGTTTNRRFAPLTSVHLLVAEQWHCPSTFKFTAKFSKVRIKSCSHELGGLVLKLHPNCSKGDLILYLCYDQGKHV